MASTKEADENPLTKLMAVDKEGLTFANKTAQWIAYERHIESQRSDRLFHDPLSGHLVGKYGKLLSDTFSQHATQLFPGLSEKGFILYHAARTKLISDSIAEWSGSNSLKSAEASLQVLNLGSGYDTRAFWDASLKDVDLYIEVDEAKVNDPKKRVLAEIETLPKLVCGGRRCISMNFATETIHDLPKHGFIASTPTCWLLEGLIMYLEAEAVKGIYEAIVELSAVESFAIVNVVNGGTISKEHHKSSFSDAIFLANGWTKVKEVMFGDTEFSYGRYPEGVEPNKSLGFVFYHKKSV
eukprot:CAMPEP_0113302336 /NCGR_PEP_ID=MMETSP0010_2-20120614/3186_1 /TAXON_ID=216773 ORGANISM="Corethron hystrix, Strain 308" /NCGR_SAMPLE_ID=MMETSP0010_2 /ASSEMBLY_ACC=CAM_ASM_000155 /LENGTH=296 /DNA_ID=CAMNT_0000156099 /DNA_START=16 /DNA_END=906 /DNA_ORIENTATION=- /assembly_acc=CAM_ASM_000155